MFTLYRIPAFAPTRKPNRIGPLFTHENGDFGSISATERSCHTALISKVENHISYRIGVYTLDTTEKLAVIINMNIALIFARLFCRACGTGGGGGKPL